MPPLLRRSLVRAEEGATVANAMSTEGADTRFPRPGTSGFRAVGRPAKVTMPSDTLCESAGAVFRAGASDVQEQQTSSV